MPATLTIDTMASPPPTNSTATLSLDTPSSAPRVRAGILGLGSYFPEDVITNAELEARVDTSDAWIMERTGIRERRRMASGETASTMGAAAGRVALERAGNPPVDAILVATASPDTLFPSTACLVQRRLDLGGIPAFDLGAACSGFIYGLVVAESLIKNGRLGTVLVIGSEAMTRLVDYSDRSTCVLFGDGAGAVVLGASTGGGICAARWGADGGSADLIYYGGPPEEPDGEPGVRMAGKGTFRLAVERLTEMGQGLCADAGWSVDEVDHVIPHQANLRIVEATAKRLGVGMDRVFFNGDRFGNTSSASIPLALADADRQGRLRRGDRIVSVAFGSGATWGGVALEWSLEPPQR
ncbi:MAG TPA: beta-ketoacyl-ACP synthase III [Candidatus Dormibacteraeota bacterium]|jgi:3-oxoacyl-[acyl-carrier-protein] synthase-3|nr:beta-ketoacyl-ACP synthase III [Candidatus Dormibacteraeota bacterium]